MVVSCALKLCQKLYRARHRDKYNERQKVYANTYYNTHKNIISEKNKQLRSYKNECKRLCNISL